MSLLDRWREFKTSPWFDAKMKAYAEKMIKEELILESQLNRFKSDWDHRFEEIMEKVVAKYNSNEYIEREHRIGYEPREKLLSFLFDYVKQRGIPWDDGKSNFPTNAFWYKGWVIGWTCGQGC